MTLRAARVRLDETLFPDTPHPSPAHGKGEQVLLVGALLTLGVILQLLRPGSTASLNSIWAEDGPVFFQAAATQSFGSTIFSPYAEYLVLVPRLIGEASTLVPLQLAPAAISILAAFVVALGGLAVWHAAAGHVANPLLRGALVAVAVLVPVAGLESVDSASYASWYMLFATFWLLFWRPSTMLGAALAALFILATALSNPGVWLFLPIAVLRAIAVRDRRDLTIVGSYGLGAAIQLPIVATHSDQAAEPTWTSDIWTAYLQRVIDGGLLGDHLGGLAWESFGWPILIALLACALAGLAVGLWRAGWGARCLAVIAIAASVAMFVVTAYQREVGTALMWPDGVSSGVSSRYVIVPALLLVSAAVVLLDSALRRHGGRLRGRVSAAAAAFLLLGVVTSFSVRDVAARGTPPWDQGLREAASTCTAQRLPDAVVPTSPPGFGVLLPCERISSFADPPNG